MKQIFDRWLIAAGGLIALLLIAGGMTFQSTRRLNRDAERVSHTHAVLTGLEEIVSLAKDAETRQRGYVISGEEQFLQRYDEAVAKIDPKVFEVEKLTADNPTQQAHFPEIKQRLTKRLAVLDEGIAARRSGSFDEARALLLSGRGVSEMDALRALIGEMKQSEHDLLKERSARSLQTFRSALVTGVLTSLAAIGSVIAFTVLLRRHLAARSAAAQVIAEQAERLRTTLASIGDGVIATDAECRITNLNPVAESLTGWKNADAAGRPLAEVFVIVNEETRAPVDNPAMKALREGVIVGLANHTVLIAKGGQERPIDDSAAPIRCKEGEIVGCVLVFRDVSDRRQREHEQGRQLHAARLLAAIVNSSDDAIISKSLQGIIQTWNAAAEHLFGHTASEAIGKHISLVIPPERLSEEDEIIARLKAGQRIDHFQTERIRKDGRRVAVSLTISPVKDDAGQVVGASKIVRDITRQREAEEERQKMEDELRQMAADLSEADRRKDEFLATLAHELRNPLAPLRNMLELMKRTDGDASVVQQARDTMERQLGQMIRLVDDLLDLSRISRDKLELRMEPVELASVLDQAVEATRPLAERAGHKLHVDLPPEPIHLHADPARLAQVFSNLLNNSCKYTPEGGEIWLRAERHEGDVVVTVKDNGTGIPPDKLDSIFEMFTQVDRTLERSQGGLGIGLTLVKRLVQMHGGTISVRSDGEGRGSEFEVRLPALIQPQSAEPEPATAEPVQPAAIQPPPAEAPAKPARRRRILVVDDNKDAAISLAMLLKMSGNETHTAHDGQEALDAVEKLNPEVVLLDIGLPILNGYEVCRRLRMRPGAKSLVLVALTGWGQEEDRRKSHEAGFNGHLVKPVDFAQLTKLLNSLSPAGAPAV